MQTKKQPQNLNGTEEMNLYQHRVYKFFEDYKKLCEKHGMQFHMIPLEHEQQKDTKQDTKQGGEQPPV